ncbi:hypothetical protein DL96DRAFT_23691 [Flagelloscypha sp. PMI_526]|nr:hypothetical protein DL96DRAFT_23691 [Flagelloscypha sp. PMI_526]
MASKRVAIAKHSLRKRKKRIGHLPPRSLQLNNPIPACPCLLHQVPLPVRAFATAECSKFLNAPSTTMPKAVIIFVSFVYVAMALSTLSFALNSPDLQGGLACGWRMKAVQTSTTTISLTFPTLRRLRPLHGHGKNCSLCAFRIDCLYGQVVRSFSIVGSNGPSLDYKCI